MRMPVAMIAGLPEGYTGNFRAGMHSFPSPIAMPEVTISLLWHPRLDADPAHRWLRGVVRDVCAESIDWGRPLTIRWRMKRPEIDHGEVALALRHHKHVKAVGRYL